ncbi:hypothetical protein HZA97_10145 [Candidatus Woesearchaeota archaeon]|nr:hypothetical protein [Candidatus Woesearchaeota archaeon]
MNDLELYNQSKTEIKNLEKYIPLAHDLLETRLTPNDRRAVEEGLLIMEMDLKHEQSTIERLTQEMFEQIATETVIDQEEINTEEIDDWLKQDAETFQKLLQEIYLELEDLRGKYKK